MSTTVRVWDLPTRTFHWALVLCMLALIITGQIGGAAMTWHFRCGYTMLSLLLFRLIWGVIGGHWSRFASFIYSPATIVAYVKGTHRAEHSVGHNPLGAGSVFAMLAFLFIQVGTGLISDDEIANAGPLARFFSGAIVNNATFYHKNIGKLILIGLVVLHVSAILFYWLKNRENLVRPMILGDKKLSFEARSARDDARSRMLGLLVFLGCGALVAWLLSLAA